MQALLFHKFKNICIKTTLWTRNTNCFTIFVHRNFRRKSHSDCEYHLVPWLRKWGLRMWIGSLRKLSLRLRSKKCNVSGGVRRWREYLKIVQQDKDKSANKKKRNSTKIDRGETETREEFSNYEVYTVRK